MNLRTVYRLIKTQEHPGRAGRAGSGDSRSTTSMPGSRVGSAGRGPRQGRRRLLLVDDDEGTRILLTKMLEKDYDVETAVDGPARWMRSAGRERATI